MQTFTDWLKNNAKDCGILAPPINPQVAINFLANYLLPKGWYCVGPANANANTEIVHAILWRYSKRYRREVKSYNKKQTFKRWL